MSMSEEPAGEIATGDQAHTDFTANPHAGGASRRASGSATDKASGSATDKASGSATDMPSDSATIRPRVTLAAGVTCPDCGLASKAEWMTKSRQGDAYATTLFCEGCGCLIAVWTAHVDARVVARQQEL